MSASPTQTARSASTGASPALGSPGAALTHTHRVSQATCEHNGPVWTCFCETRAESSVLGLTPGPVPLAGSQKRKRHACPVPQPGTAHRRGHTLLPPRWGPWLGGIRRHPDPGPWPGSGLPRPSGSCLCPPATRLTVSLFLWRPAPPAWVSALLTPCQNATLPRPLPSSLTLKPGWPPLAVLTKSVYDWRPDRQQGGGSLARPPFPPRRTSSRSSLWCLRATD